jgi:hypothetical protein
MIHAYVSLNFTRRRVSLLFLLTILMGKKKYGKFTGGNVWSRVDSPSNMAEDKKFMTNLPGKIVA